MTSRTRLWASLSVGVLASFVAIQLVPYGSERTNPPVLSEPQWDSPDTRALARRACFDCHSNETNWPAYARIAPASWLIQHDVTEGRQTLNFSEWQRAQEESSEASEEVRDHEMPPALYRVMHSAARLNPTERETLARGLANTIARHRSVRGQ